MTWFYRVSHAIMTPNALERPPSSANQEVLEAWDDHNEDISAVCQCIVKMGRVGIEA